MMYRKTIAMIAACAACAAMMACAPSQEKIRQTVDNATKINADLDSAYLALAFSFESYKPQQMDAALDGLKSFLGVARQRLSKAGLKDKGLKDAIAGKIDVMEGLAANECAEQVRLYKISEVEFTESNRNEWDEYASAAARKMSEANSKVDETLKNISRQSTL